MMPRALKPMLAMLITLFATSSVDAATRYPYQRCFEIAANMHDLPLDLILAVAATESNWDADARSHANAHGIMQIQWPGTARYLGVKRVAELYNPCLNIELGSRYLKELITRFGNETKALAAYNYGPGRIERATSIPKGALGYAATVAKHRKKILAGQLPDKLHANKESVLVVFDSKTRAARLANKLTEALEGATATHAPTRGGSHAVRLAVGQSGLTMGDKVMLQSLGFSP